MTLAPVGPSGPPALLPELSGMSRDQALAFVSRMYDAAAAGDHLMTSDELVEAFLQPSNCSRTRSAETVSGYRREIAKFRNWLWGWGMSNGRGELELRDVTPQICREWIAWLNQQVQAEAMAERSFNRSVAAISSMFRWASEPINSETTGCCRNPVPRRQLIKVDPMPRPLPEGDLVRVINAIEESATKGSRNAQRDLVMVRGFYLTGLRVSELANLRWGHLEATATGGRITVKGKGSKVRRIVVSTATLELFNSIRPQGAGEADWVFPSGRKPGERMTRQGIGSRIRAWGNRARDAAGNPIKLWCHRLRHQHATTAVERGCDPFVLQRSMGWASLATATSYVEASATDGSSLRLG